MESFHADSGERGSISRELSSTNRTVSAARSHRTRLVHSTNRNRTGQFGRTVLEFIRETNGDTDDFLHGNSVGALVGPGAYDMPGLLGSKKFITSYYNAPSFTISGRNISDKQFISKKHCLVLCLIPIETNQHSKSRSGEVQSADGFSISPESALRH